MGKRNLANSYVGECLELVIGLKGMFCLCIFGRPYRCGGLLWCGVRFVRVLSVIYLSYFFSVLYTLLSIVVVGSLVSVVGNSASLVKFVTIFRS